MEANGSIGVGLIGHGYSGKTFHAPLLRTTHGLELKCVCSRNPGNLSGELPGVDIKTDAAALIGSDEVELVVIATPNDSHARLAQAALLAGKHVVIDKPFTLDLASARHLVNLANRHSRLISAFHNRRWDSDYLSVKRAIANEAVGEVLHFESHFDRFRPAVQRRWRESSAPGNGIWFDLGPHLVDQALQFFGLPDKVQATLAQQRDGAETNDWAHVLLSFGPKRRVILHASMLAAHAPYRFLIQGTTGTLIKRTGDMQESQLRKGWTPASSGWGEDPDDLLCYRGDGSRERIPAQLGDYGRYYTGISNAIRLGEPNPVTPIQVIAVMALLEAAVESNQQGTAVGLSLTPSETAEFDAAL